MVTKLNHLMKLQSLQRRPELVGNDRRRVDIAVHEMHRLEGVLQEVLDFAKPVMLDTMKEYRRIKKNRGIHGMIDLRRFNPSRFSSSLTANDIFPLVTEPP